MCHLCHGQVLLIPNDIRRSVIAFQKLRRLEKGASSTHNKMKTLGQNSISQEFDGCQGASAELSATQVKKLEELEERIDEQPDKQSYKPRPFEDPRGYQGKEEDAGWLEQHEKAMRGPGHLRYKDVRYITAAHQ